MKNNFFLRKNIGFFCIFKNLVYFCIVLRGKRCFSSVVEHFLGKEEVPGSSPGNSSEEDNRMVVFFCFWTQTSHIDGKQLESEPLSFIIYNRYRSGLHDSSPYWNK